jgi:hypothetical protein
MKTILPVITLLAALSATPLFAEEGMKCGCMKKPDEKSEMQKKMDAKMKAEAAEIGALIDQMNSTTGERKVEAMAALLNRLIQERKAMHEKMAAMHEKMAPEKKPGEAAKPAEHDHEHKADGAAAKPAEHQH